MSELDLTVDKERYRDDLKTMESVRETPLTPKVEALLKKYIERNKFIKSLIQIINIWDTSSLAFLFKVQLTGNSFRSKRIVNFTT